MNRHVEAKFSSPAVIPKHAAFLVISVYTVMQLFFGGCSLEDKPYESWPNDPEGEDGTTIENMRMVFMHWPGIHCTQASLALLRYVCN